MAQTTHSTKKSKTTTGNQEWLILSQHSPRLTLPSERLCIQSECVGHIPSDPELWLGTSRLAVESPLAWLIFSKLSLASRQTSFSYENTPSPATRLSSLLQRISLSCVAAWLSDPAAHLAQPPLGLPKVRSSPVHFNSSAFALWNWILFKYCIWNEKRNFSLCFLDYIFSATKRCPIN